MLVIAGHVVVGASVFEYFRACHQPLQLLTVGRATIGAFIEGMILKRATLKQLPQLLRSSTRHDKELRRAHSVHDGGVRKARVAFVAPTARGLNNSRVIPGVSAPTRCEPLHTCL